MPPSNPTLKYEKWNAMTDSTIEPIDLDQARDRALEVRALYEILEQRFNGKVWSFHEIDARVLQ